MPSEKLSTQPVIYAVDMEDSMVEHAKDVASEAFLNSQNSTKCFPVIAAKIRSSFDEKFEKCWNCIVGRSFGSFVTHKTKRYIYYSVVQGVSILLWQS